MSLIVGQLPGMALAAALRVPDGVREVERPKSASQKRDRIRALREWEAQAEREAAADRIAAQKRLFGGEGGVAAAAVEATPGGFPDYFGDANWAYSPPLRKFVDGLPGLGASNPNNLGNYLPVAHPDTLTYPGADYYEIELRQFTQQMHSDLPSTTLRGYVQVNKGTADGTNTVLPDPIHYLGPSIVAQKDRPVRIKFINKLGTGTDGDLFIPVDTTVMGAGMGPLGMDAMPMNYTQNRGTLHLHGGKSPWISDGTAHQWITPAGEMTPYPKGVSVRNVPDMPDPGPGAATFYYTNQQSARLMFYHDHSYGITRLNVYAGEAAPYVLQDEVEQDLVARGLVPSSTIPLVIQDKTFVDTSTVRVTDPTWNWGTGAVDQDGVREPVQGDLWYPHVYSPAQNPADLSGMNAFGRWHYGPWFWPPTQDISHPPTSNPYYDPVNAPWEPPLAPDIPNPSMPGEAFMDTPLVNGTAFPTLTVEPKAYRFRILNAADDRFWNLQLYKSDPDTMSADGRANTEVKMVNASVCQTSFPEGWPTDGREGGVPSPDTTGPAWIQIGSEGGFLPKPAVVPQQPITWNMDPTTFNFGNVDLHSLLVAPAERADVIVDFSQYAGQTLILYNDAPAAFPARDGRLDYYTGSPNLTETGGYWGTEVGFGPNTRTIMQITVADTAPAPEFDLAALEAEFASTVSTEGVFEKSQDPIIMPDARYDSAYASSFPEDPYVRIYDSTKSYTTVRGNSDTRAFKPKAIQDEMGEAFDIDYGRMSGKLGLSLPNNIGNRQTFVLQNFVDPVTEEVQPEFTAMSPVAGDGTQIWKITHNGVDTHPIHFHLFDVQVINRVGWDNGVRPPDDNELGWKDTVRVSPLEDTIVALRPTVPKVPFGQPNNVRPLNPAEPIGSMMGFSNLGPDGEPLVPPTMNEMVDFGHEYTWHCHILSHEEMDMMRPIKASIGSSLPVASALTGTRTAGSVSLTWTDATPPDLPSTLGNGANEIGFRVQRATFDANGTPTAYSTIATALANATAYVDGTAGATTRYLYRVVAFNAAGDSPSNALQIGTATSLATRISGADRYSTALAAARDAFPNWAGLTRIIVSSGADPLVDPLSAASLSKAYNAPVLLCPPTSVPTYLRDAITQAGGSNAVTITIVGGGIGTTARNQLLATTGVRSPLDVIAGSDRYATSQLVARRVRDVMGPRAAVFFVNGQDEGSFYDAAGGSAIAAAQGFPLLLVRRQSVPANTLSTVTYLGTPERFIIGGTGVVSSSVGTQLGVNGANRWAGVDRHATAVAVANSASTRGWLSKSVVGIAQAVPEAVAGGAATGAKGGCLLLCGQNTLPTVTRDFLIANKAVIIDCKVYGGTGAISATVFNAINAALQ